MTVFELAQLVTRIWDIRDTSYNKATNKYLISRSDAVDTVLRDNPQAEDCRKLISYLSHSGEAYEILSDIIITANS